MNMIEKVARAIAFGAGQRVVSEGSWYADHYWQKYRDDARAVIEAIREPTDEALAAAVPDEDKSGAPYVVDRSIFKEHYQQMIDAALEGK